MRSRIVPQWPILYQPPDAGRRGQFVSGSPRAIIFLLLLRQPTNNATCEIAVSHCLVQRILPLDLPAEDCMTQLLAAAQHVYAQHYSKPYPQPAEGAPDAYFMDLDAKEGVERPNHGLANALRKAFLVYVAVVLGRRHYCLLCTVRTVAMPAMCACTHDSPTKH